MLDLQFSNYDFKIKEDHNQQKIFDIIRKKFVVLTPEEWVRQHIIHYLITALKYPKGLISVEKEIRVNQLKKRYDIVVFDTFQNPWMLIECKEPEVVISDSTLEQLMRYHQVLQCPFWMLTNGKSSFCAKIEAGNIRWLNELPTYDS